jgi:hypothetical protein
MSNEVYNAWLCAQHTVDAVARRSQRADRVPREAQVWPLENELYEQQLFDADASIRERSLRPALIDLTTVFASQVTVALDDPRFEGLTVEPSTEQLLEICLPLRSELEPAVGFDEKAQSWIIRSRGATLEMTGRYAGGFEGLDPRAQGFGFIVSAQPSRMLAFNVDGRLVLRDGHHRAVALLARGIHRVPALVGEGHFRDFTAHGTLSLQRLSEPAAPLLTDYFDDEVSVDMELPRTERVMMIQSTQFELPS